VTEPCRAGKPGGTEQRFPPKATLASSATVRQTLVGGPGRAGPNGQERLGVCHSADAASLTVRFRTGAPVTHAGTEAGQHQGGPTPRSRGVNPAIECGKMFPKIGDA
jgi:hypothetical protein